MRVLGSGCRRYWGCRRCERVGVDVEMLWGSPVPQSRADGKVLLYLCYGAGCEPERMKDAGEGGCLEERNI